MKYKLLLITALIASAALMQSCTKESDNSSASVSDQSLSRLASGANVYLQSSAKSFSTISSFRVRMNAVAAQAYDAGQRSDFPSSSMFVKEKYNSAGELTGYAIMYKAPSDPNEMNGWLWSEYDANGNVIHGTSLKASNCQSCHKSYDLSTAMNQ